MDDKGLEGLRAAAGAYFPDQVVARFLKEIDHHIQSGSRLYYQLTQSGSAPILVVGILKTRHMVNLALGPGSTRVSSVTYANLLLVELFDPGEGPGPTILRAHVPHLDRPEQYFEYSAATDKSRRDLLVFARVLMARTGGDT